MELTSSRTTTPSATSAPDGARASTTTVDQLMSSIERTISVTRSLEDAARLVSGTNTAALLLGLSHQPLGLISESDLASEAAEDPERWKRRRCACLAQSVEDSLTPTDSLETVLGRYRDAEAKPLLVVDDFQPVGILYPDDVFAWCLEERASVFDALGLVGDQSPPASPSPA
ncbi:CBS domain-containing protein [Nesterenkonia lutea]|uniref:Signal-transduction protein with cAMP-binding, CBS, and nucleotidyltransferase domain n=1 Tax=Nesterenkonia lutea TaxID=272919 RepID=A0ABR9JBW9_9MICC|nr:CBS domain-containing protein [Nesterenkonia lutea]MBE1523426.1 signal-transduction protein with cAMP-binding, CBS, and nucleotidyltransferase domain [Nesterenkonia lutea]